MPPSALPSEEDPDAVESCALKAGASFPTVTCLTFTTALGSAAGGAAEPFAPVSAMDAAPWR
eukprot:5523905-Prymnesium_polylepis.1